MRVELTRELQIVRLGQGVDASGQLHPDALARTFAAAERYAELLRAYGVDAAHTRVVATSAARDARNVEEFFVGMEQRLGRAARGDRRVGGGSAVVPGRTQRSRRRGLRHRCW